MSAPTAQRPGPAPAVQPALTVDEPLLDKVLAATCDNLDRIAQRYAQEIRDTEAPLRRAMLMADGIDRLRRALEEASVKGRIMSLMGSALGFLTDRKEGKQPYDWHTVRDAIIEGLLRGVFPVGNELNIIAGRCYVTKEGYERLLRELPGFTDFNFQPGPPAALNGKVVVRVCASWKYQGMPQCLRDGKGEPGRIFEIPTNSYTGPDAVIGKAKRKAMKAIYERCTGTMQTEADDGEIFTDAMPATPSETKTDTLAAKLQQRLNGDPPPPPSTDVYNEQAPAAAAEAVVETSASEPTPDEAPGDPDIYTDDLCGAIAQASSGLELVNLLNLMHEEAAGLTQVHVDKIKAAATARERELNAAAKVPARARR